MEALLTPYTSVSQDPYKDHPHNLHIMEDEMSGADTPVLDDSGELTFDKQVASLKSYLDALPYECESVDDMQAQLEGIVGKICICADTKNWQVLSTWDGMLQW